MSLIIEASRFAHKMHSGQFRKWTNEQYIVHPMRVAAAVSWHPIATEELVAAAWLHDVEEDCGVFNSHLRKMFGQKVSDYVYWMTNRKDPMATREARKATDRQRLMEAPKAVQVLKMADRIDNLSDMSACPNEEFKKLYSAESLLLAEAIGSADESLKSRLIDLARTLAQ